MARKIETWLAYLSDPAGLNVRWTPKPFTLGETERLRTLVEEAGRHNVRPALVRNLALLVKNEPGAVMSGEMSAVRAAIEPAIARANELRLLDVARASMLATLAREILASVAAAGLPVALVKGLDFAEAAYGGLHNRAFTDIDLLVRPDAEIELGEILARLGFKAHEPPANRVALAERKWTKTNAHGNEILVEIHTDVVHSPKLRPAMSLTYDLYASREAGGVNAASRLVLAALHGAASHLFGRLQYVVDALMIVRMGVDAGELRERARRSGAILPLATNLRLAADIYDCAACRTLEEKIGHVPWNWLERRLVTAPMALSAKSPHRWRLLPQRYLYGALMRN
jgi:hypothetical protein